MKNIKRSFFLQTDVSYNIWQPDVEITEDDFQSLDVEQLIQPRKSDGSLPVVTFMHLISGSDILNNGVDVGSPFIGSAPM